MHSYKSPKTNLQEILTNIYSLENDKCSFSNLLNNKNNQHMINNDCFGHLIELSRNVNLTLFSSTNNIF
ncbi:unnamed protein product [Schistosoma margrebowiei]|uniref:Uncharacterized protein n=1 Tax=Schistosoma margrebowiei TaxID=48269 RepID=A0AA85A090_9TREM|nr:unnamed protein product [Schistosoma margrebowiei]